MQGAEFDLDAGSELTLQRSGGPDVVCEVIRGLGHGTFSQTFLARSGDGAWVVLKGPRWIGDRFDANLRVEAGILSQLEHPNVVRYLGQGAGPSGQRVLGYERGFPHPVVGLGRPAVRELLEPEPETRHVPLPLQIALQLGLDLLRGIEHLHGQGFVHHDIKLENVLVRLPDQEDEPPLSAQLDHALAGRAQLFLIDIGGSRAKAYLSDLNAGRGREDAALVPPQVTPKYAPPEAILPRDDAPQRSWLLPSMDLYAAAIVIYTSLTGREPYEHLAQRVQGLDALRAIKRKEREGLLEPLSRRALGEVPGAGPFADELGDFLSVCMHADPEERPTAPEARACFAELVEAYGGGRQASADADQPFFGVSR